MLIEYPRKGIYSIGFFTQDTKGEVQRRLKHDVVSVFLPTTPNPTSGFLLFVPKNEVTDLDLTIEEALKLVISGGAIIPTSTHKSQIENEAPQKTESSSKISNNQQNAADAEQIDGA